MGCDNHTHTHAKHSFTNFMVSTFITHPVLQTVFGVGIGMNATAHATLYLNNVHVLLSVPPRLRMCLYVSVCDYDRSAVLMRSVIIIYIHTISNSGSEHPISRYIELCVKP